MSEKNEELKKKVDCLSGILCKTAKGIENCPVVDFVHDITNIVLYDQLNKSLVASRVDKLEARIENLCNEIMIVQNENRKLRKKLTNHIDKTGE